VCEPLTAFTATAKQEPFVQIRNVGVESTMVPGKPLYASVKCFREDISIYLFRPPITSAWTWRQRVSIRNEWNFAGKTI
jgi:hypothetical protein